MPETFDAVSAADAPAPETVFDQIRREAAEEQEQAADTAASPGEDPGTDAPVEPDWDSPAAAGTGEPAPQEYNR